MMTKQRLPLLTIAMLLGLVLPAAAAPPAPAPPKGPKAGSITALLPIARIDRGAGKAKVTTDAKKGDDIVWNDNIRTEKGGRARITLADQSVLSLGSQAELRVVKHDARTQQTALSMTYGRVRAEVAKVTRQGGGFELRTPTAVAGVIGTDFGADSSQVGSTTFLCISGIVQVSNSDPNIAGSVQCTPGLTTTVTAGKAPTPPENATQEQIQQMILDTEPAIISAMSPMSALPGMTLDATLSGSKLGGVKSANVSGSGIAITLSSVTDESATVHLVIAPDAEPGPRTIHLVKSSGADSAAVFTILALSTAQGGDYKKPFLDLIGQEGQTTSGGLNAYLLALKQTADQAIQQLQQANASNVNLNDATNDFTSQVTAVQNAINAAKVQIDEAVTLATNSFQTQYDTAYQALLQRNPAGTPDDEFNQAVKSIFDSINSSLGNTFTAIRSNLNAAVSAANTNIQQAQQTWMTTIIAASNPPVPAVNSTERSIDLGAAFGSGGIAALDAGNSKASGGASIISYKWVLCDSSYKPAQFGVPLAANATAGCNPLSGYQSSSSDFQFPTCNLPANDYIARVTVTDSNNNAAAMDVKVHVLAGAYDDPTTRVRNLAQAYMTLQPNNFLAFFDETGFSGFTSLSENVRNTFPLLASMQINPRVSQAAITCNDATVRADWVQNYTYKENPNISFDQTEQLSMRMVRQPGKGWFITDFQGDNGTVQGQLPGPAVTDTAQPDLVTLGVYPTYVGSTSTNPPVPPGAQSFTAVVQNIGGADLTTSVAVRFQLLDASNNPLGNAVDMPLPTPLAAGESTNVQVTMDVPSLAVGTPFQVLANANPTCLPEAHCDAANQASEALILGTPVTLTQVNALTLITADPGGGTVQVQVSAASTVTITLPAGLQLKNAPGNTASKTVASAQTVSWDVVATFAATAGTNLNSIVISADSFVPVTLNYVYTVVGVPNYVISAVNFGGVGGPYTGANAMQVGAASTLNFTVQNIGNGSPSGTITVTAVCVPVNAADTTSCVGGGNPTVTVAAPAAGLSVPASAPVDFNGILPGSFTGIATLTTSIQQSTADDTFSLPFDVADFIVTVQSPLNPQYILPGSSQNVTVSVTTVGTTPFAVSVAPSAAYSGISVTPVSAGVNNTTQVFAVTAAAGTAPGTFAATFTGTNRGVTHPASESFEVITPQIVSTNLFLNDASNPLDVQKGATTPQTVSLKLSGAVFSGSATIVPPISVVGFTTNINPTTSVPANGTFDLTVSASSSATSVVTPMVVAAQLPGTNPVLSITYTLYVRAVGLADLQVLSANATAISANTPWIDGMGVDFDVVVKNNGNLASVGGERITISLNGIEVGQGTVGSLAPGTTSSTITVHAVAPDIHGNNAFSGSGTVKVKVEPDAAGDLNYADNTLTPFNVPLANWHFSVSGAGSDANNKLFLHTDRTPPYTNQVTFAGAIDGASIANYNPALFAPTAGQTSSYITIGNFSGAGTGSFTGDVTLTNGAAQAGDYFAQVIVQMHDGATVTAQRQATVWIDVSTGFGGAPVPCLTSSANNVAAGQPDPPCAPVSAPAAVQINGGLAEQVSLSLDFFCLSAQTTAAFYFSCPGAADLAIHDASNTNTTPLSSVNGVQAGTPLVLRVAAAFDPNGNIQTGAASGYTIGINGIQNLTLGAARGATTSPDPVGVQVPMLFNVGDLTVTANTGANSCTGVVANGTPLQLSVSWQTSGGFNAPSLSWQWENGNHSPVGASPLSFSSPSGTSTYSGGSYSPSPSFTLTNTQAQDGIATYFLAVTISNGTSTATKYFPFYFDLSLSQNFCGAVSSARGYSRIQGTWSRSAAGFGGPVSQSAVRLKTETVAGTADIHISASDVSFTPSLPKVGDEVQVRFRARNDGDADAVGMPIALQINGVTVTSDTFDVPKGRSVLGGLTWTASAEFARSAMDGGAVRPRIKGKVVDPDAAPTADTSARAGRVALQAAVVVDPQHLTVQKTALDKSATIAHLSLRTAAGDGAVVANSQRILIELEDGACVGLRLSSGGTMPCGTADLEITIGDLAKSLLSFETMSGVGDLGTSFESARRGSRADVRYGAQAAAMSGHSYSVQLPNGNTAVVNVESVRNPAELDAKARALFRASAARVLRGLGDSSGAQAPGELTGGGSRPTVFIILNVLGM